MDSGLVKLRSRLRGLSMIAPDYMPDRRYAPLHAFPVELRGYSEATINLAVFKKTNPPEFALEQANFMNYLGTEICPKVLAITMDGYFMEYLSPVDYNEDSLVMQERILQNVWNRDASCIFFPEIGWRQPLRDHIKVEVPDWALGPLCMTHGDPTLDNVLMTRQGFLRITDPIPPLLLKKPNIQAVDHGKILQSMLGWETVLRGVPILGYTWPSFMNKDFDTARRAVFWAMVAVKRIVFRDMSDRITEWATLVAQGLEELCA